MGPGSFIHSDLNFIYKAILANNVAAIGNLNDRGDFDASADHFPSADGSGTGGAILKGNLWRISVEGTIGGTHVYVGYTIRALVDAPTDTAADWNIMNVGLGYIPVNKAGDTMTGNLTLVAGSVSVAPLTFQSGTNLDTPLDGTAEYNGTNLFFTREDATREYVVVGDTASAPSTLSSFTMLNCYGGDTNFLGDPASWLSFVQGETTYVIPLYT